MAQNITLQGASYSDVPSVVLPKTGGGTASFTDVTDTTAAASDVASGKYFFTANGVLTLGTSSGGGTEAGTVTQDADGYLVLDDDPPAGPTLVTKSITANGTYNASSDSADGYSSVTVNVSGGGGLVYETGTWTPASDINSYEIQFTNSHSTAPFVYLVADATNTYSDVTSSSYLVAFVDWSAAFNASFNVTESTYRNGRLQCAYRSTATTLSDAGTNLSNSTSQSETASTLYWADTTRIKAYANSASRYWRAGRTYKWIAVWAPTS